LRKIPQQCGARYAECFGTKKEQRHFYKHEFKKYLWVWSASTDKDGRIHFSIVAPPNSIKATSVRGMLKEALWILPKKRSGGRPRSVQPSEIPYLRKEVERVAVERGDTRTAIKRVAELEGMDPRTLKAALGAPPPMSGTARTKANSGNEQKQQHEKHHVQMPSGHHYRRNTRGCFDVVY
jgi:hypothetical protein